MTRKECLIEILKDFDKLTSSEITDKFYELYPDIIEEKRQSYINKNVNKTDKQLWDQLRAELISFMTQHDKSNSFIQFKNDGKTYYKLNKKPVEETNEKPEWFKNIVEKFFKVLGDPNIKINYNAKDYISIKKDNILLYTFYCLKNSVKIEFWYQKDNVKKQKNRRNIK